MGEVKKNCLCGAGNCSGFIGKKPSNESAHQDESSGKGKNGVAASARKSGKKDNKGRSKMRKEKIVKKQWEDLCFRCFDVGELLMCDHKTCPKVGATASSACGSWYRLIAFVGVPPGVLRSRQDAPREVVLSLAPLRHLREAGSQPLHALPKCILPVSFDVLDHRPVRQSRLFGFHYLSIAAFCCPPHPGIITTYSPFTLSCA